MLPTQPWLSAMNIESTLPPRQPSPRQATAGSLRRGIGHLLISLGRLLVGPEGTARTQISVGR